MKKNEDYCVLPYAEADVQHPAAGVTRRVLAYAEDVMAVENTFAKGAVGSLHSHPHS